MEGPTPVSALIHAATMVTAGVFLLLRCSVIVEFSPDVRTIAVILGSTTTMFGAITATFQADIKRVIAFSTSSQPGYYSCHAAIRIILLHYFIFLRMHILKHYFSWVLVL